MRRLTILVLVAASLYSAYWFVGANRVEAGAKDALVQLAADGWDVSHTGVATRGYPSRFDTTVSALALASPDGTLSYTAPFVQAFALSYRPTEVIMAFADTQQIRLGAQTIDITSQRLRASAAVTAGTSLPLKEATIEVTTAQLTSNFGWGARAENGIFALRPTQGRDLHYDLYLGARVIQLDTAPPLVDLVFDSTVSLDRPLDRYLLADAAPLIETVDVKSLQLVWDKTRLSGSGTLGVDRAGIPTGEIIFQVTNWQDLVPNLVTSGLIKPNLQFAMLAIMQGLARADGTLSLPLRFAGGNMQLGPIPLGPAPRLR